jgi:TIR domain/SIR2-like domain
MKNRTKTRSEEYSKMSFAKVEEWTDSGLVSDFVEFHKQMEDASFAFVLGAGASVTSGIPTGGQLAKQWVDDLYKRMTPQNDPKPMEEWASEETLGVSGFEASRIAEFYSEVYERRFRGDPKRGYAYLENIMENAEPSFGYSVLAQILSTTRHRVVITTNFDNLVSDALSIYASKLPLVCGHESLTGFVRAKLRRPLVAKIHRDILLEPYSDKKSTEQLAKGWTDALVRLFREYTPIVIGYGGNDGSLMGFLESIDRGDISGRIRWCYHTNGESPSDRVITLMKKLDGIFVPILGFDHLMLMLSVGLGYELLDTWIEEKSQERVTLYRQQVEQLKVEIGQLYRRDDLVAPNGNSKIDSVQSAMNAFTYYSCFISYAHADKAFARKIHDQLQARGIRCWLDEHQLLPGDDIYQQAGRGIRLWDKVLLCCSEASLSSWWVDYEVEKALEKEQKLRKERGKQVLSIIPLNLDGFLFSDKCEYPMGSTLRKRLAADFTGWENDEAKFEKAFEAVVKTLRADEKVRESLSV